MQSRRADERAITISSQYYCVKETSYDSLSPHISLPTWPLFKGPTPLGVPVKIISPGTTVKHSLMYLRDSGTPHIIWLAAPRCLSSPSSLKENSVVRKSGKLATSIQGPITAEFGKACTRRWASLVLLFNNGPAIHGLVLCIWNLQL
jgi:hypothetical protein